MNNFKRALIYVMANKGKTALVFIIFFVTMAAVSVGFISKKMYDNTLQEAFAEGAVPVYITPEYPDTMVGNLTYDWSDYIEVSTQNYLDMANLEQVVDSTIELSSDIYLGDFQLADEVENQGYDTLSVTYTDAPNNEESYYDEALSLEYDKDEYKNIENSVILNDQFLELNDLEVGDKIDLDMNSAYTETSVIEELAAIEFTIVGSYSTSPTREMIDQEKADAETYDYEPDLTFGYLYNKAYMPEQVGLKINTVYEENASGTDSGIWTNATFDLNSLNDVDSFKEDAEAITGFPLEIGYDSYSEVLEGLQLIQSINYMIKYFLMAGVTVVIILLTVIITLFIRGRKKELGILVALGETKKNIFIQLVMEQAIILMIATIISYPICFIGLQIAATKFSFSTSFSIMPLILSILTGIIIVAIITIIPTIYTLRLKPKKILL